MIILMTIAKVAKPSYKDTNSHARYMTIAMTMLITNLMTILMMIGMTAVMIILMTIAKVAKAKDPKSHARYDKILIIIVAPILQFIQ